LDEDGRSDPNRNVYRVLDDDYIPLEERLVMEEELMDDPRIVQAKVPVGGSDINDQSRTEARV
jgi:hypothetical protein